jgi:NAD-dependent dihydropyrimidine dehydrogenase PreA subunit
MDPGGNPVQPGRWYPVIEVDACIGMQDCLKICERNVLRWDPAAGHPVVSRGENCEAGCTACMEACPVHAISVPAPAATTDCAEARGTR